MRVERNPRTHSNPAGTITDKLAAITEQALRQAGYDPAFYLLQIATHGARLCKIINLRPTPVAEIVFDTDLPLVPQWQAELATIQKGTIYATH